MSALSLYEGGIKNPQVSWKSGSYSRFSLCWPSLPSWSCLRLAHREGTDPAAAQIAIYKDQLSEIDADLVRARWHPPKPRPIALEAARRLLAIAQEHRQTASGRKWLIVARTSVPLLAVAVYSRVGVPPADLPQAERLANAETANDLEAMVYKVEQHLQQTSR